MGRAYQRPFVGEKGILPDSSIPSSAPLCNPERPILPSKALKWRWGWDRRARKPWRPVLWLKKQRHRPGSSRSLRRPTGRTVALQNGARYFHTTHGDPPPSGTNRATLSISSPHPFQPAWLWWLKAMGSKGLSSNPYLTGKVIGRSRGSPGSSEPERPPRISGGIIGTFGSH